jgi:hypothetical protein
MHSRRGKDASRERRYVADGSAGWVGVDPSTRSLALAGIRADGSRWMYEWTVPALRGAERLAWVHRCARLIGAGLPPQHGPIGMVLVEAPLAGPRDQELLMVSGVVQAGLYEGLTSVQGWGTVETISPASRWKKIATGYGGHKKPKKQKGGPPVDPFDYGVLVWARDSEWRYQGVSWDCADACGIAEAAWRVYDLVPA